MIIVENGTKKLEGYQEKTLHQGALKPSEAGCMLKFAPFALSIKVQLAIRDFNNGDYLKA